MDDRLDIIVFGATGFTGKFTLVEVYKLSKKYGKVLTWGIAGRSENKLKDVLVETSNRIGGEDLSSVQIVIADVNDEESLKKMTSAAKVIINCVGPYDVYGEVVVKACIETNTHHVDVSAEMLFQERIEAKYHKIAKEKGVYIVSACGIDSVATDLGLTFVEKNFEGTLNSMEIFIHGYEEGGRTYSSVANIGTWNSAIRAVEKYKEILKLRKGLNLVPLPSLKPKLWPRIPLRKVKLQDKENKWILPVPSPDLDVIKRSQRYFYEHDKKRPVQIFSYIMVDSFLLTLQFIIFGLLFIILTQFQFGRNLLTKYPNYFSSGLFSNDSPLEDKLNRVNFSFTFLCKGWSEKLLGSSDQYKTLPNKEIVACLSGVNPAYGFTCTALTLCAIMILTQPKNLPMKGGVYTTAVAFSRTTIIEELQKNNFKYEILSIREI